MPERTSVSPADLGPTIDRMIVSSPMPSGRRLLGIEYERLLLSEVDQSSAPLEFCRDLLARLCMRFEAEPLVDGEVLKGLRSDRFEMSMEPGGQLEVACAPVTQLREVEDIMRGVDAGIAAELERSGYRLASFGHAPVTSVEELGLLPRERYQIMDRSMPERGPLTRNMMRATAGFQLTYDVEDRADAAHKLALLYRLSPVLVALSANSRRVAGEDSGYASYRHHVWLETDHLRSGIPDGCLHAETAIEGYVRYAKRAAVLFLNDPNRVGGLIEVKGGLSLESLCAAGHVTEADVDLHLTSLFPFVRLRNYIEVRCLDSVDWGLARSMLALISGIVYCEAATANAVALSEDLVVEDPVGLLQLHEEAALFGLDASAPSGDSLRSFALSLVEFASRTLGGGDCDWAKASDLDAVRSWIEAEAKGGQGAPVCDQ